MAKKQQTWARAAAKRKAKQKKSAVDRARKAEAAPEKKTDESKS